MMSLTNIWDKFFSSDDLAVSATCWMVKDYKKSLGDIEGKIGTILDLGCGYGGIAFLTADYFGADILYGADKDASKLKIAGRRGLRVMEVDLSYQRIPLANEQIDLIICNGVIEHLPYYDHIITEAYRVLKPHGYFLITMPNLGNYIQRLSLILGFQPSDVSISNKIQVGTLFDAGRPSVGHIHSATIGAMRQLLTYYKFHIISMRKGNPEINGGYYGWAIPIEIIGYIVPINLARRIIIVSRK